jgi:hypothetical protein
VCGVLRPSVAAYAPRVRRFLLPTLAGFIGATFSAGLLRKGVVLGPDSWAYWEGSVSLLERGDYTYFGGEPVTNFPPLFSGGLALFQAGLGVSVRTLAVALALFVATGSFAWMSIFASVTLPGGTTPDLPPGKSGTAHDLLALWYVPATLAVYGQVLLSESLWLVLLAVLLLLLLAPAAPSSPVGEAVRLAGAWLVLSGLLLCRNVTVAVLPAIFLMVFRRKANGPFRRRLAMASAVSVGALAPWYFVRRSYGQLANHPPFMPHGVLERLEEMLAQLAYAFGPARLRIGAVLLLAVSVLLLWELVASRPRPTGIRAPPAALVEFTLVGLAGLAGLLSVTHVGKPLEGRFVVFAVLSSTLAVIAAARLSRDGLRRRALTATAVLLTLVALYRVGVKYRLAGREQPVVPLNVTISSFYWSGPPRPQGSLLVVAPPTYPWLRRSGLR